MSAACMPCSRAQQLPSRDIPVLKGMQAPALTQLSHVEHHVGVWFKKGFGGSNGEGLMYCTQG